MSFLALIKNQLPIIQAPMAGGITPPMLVAAVSNAGAVGSFGFAYSKAEKIDADLSEVRLFTKRPINANFFIFSKPRLSTAQDWQIATEALVSLPFSRGTLYQAGSQPFYPDLDKQLEPIWTHKPEILTFHFGVPPKNVLEKAKSLGIYVGVTATCVEEAEAIQSSGADFIVAQGIEAGGHRGTFSEEGVGDQKHPTFDLLQMLRERCTLPIISAGGIMNGADIVKHTNQGATGVQMGTSFVCCDESGADPVHKKYVLEERERHTVYTKAFSGRWAQSIQTEFTSLMKDKFVLPFPLQNTLTGSLRSYAAIKKNGEYQSLWAGRGFREARSLPAAKLISEFVLEMKAALSKFD